MPATLLAVVDDLFFTVKIQDAAKRAGFTLTVVNDADRAVERAEAELVIVDLNIKSLDPIALIKRLKEKRATVVAFVPHVQVELKQRALDAGADSVSARSVFERDLAALLNRIG
jgi:DNA-binding response OmpR family regulator